MKILILAGLLSNVFFGHIAYAKTHKFKCMPAWYANIKPIALKNTLLNVSQDTYGFIVDGKQVGNNKFGIVKLFSNEYEVYGKDFLKNNIVYEKTVGQTDYWIECKK
jgi:hypothetical protein